MAFKAGAIFGTAELDTKKWDSGLKRMTGGVTKSMKIIATTFVAGMTVATKKADDFAKAMSNVASITDETEVNITDLSKQMLTMDTRLGSATELTEGLYQAFSAGAETTEEAIQITTDAAIFAKAVITDQATAVDVLTTATNAYGKENLSTTEAADLFFLTVREGKVTGDQLASSIGASIPLFASMGIEMDQLTAGIAAMTKQGINANNATTQLNAIVNAFIKPSEAMRMALEEQGIASGSALLETEGLSGALEFLEIATQGDAEAMAQLIPNIRGLRGVMALTGEGGDIFNATLDEMANASGTAQAAFEEQEVTFETLKNSLDNGLTVVGNIAKAFVDDMARGIAFATDGFVSFIMSAEGGQLVGQIVGFVAGAFNALKAAFEPIVNVLGPAWEMISEAIADLMAELGVETGNAAGASKLLAIAGNLLASGFTIVAKVIQSGIENVINLVRAMRESGETIGTFFKALTGRASFREVREQAREAADAMENFSGGVVQNIGEIVQTAIDEFKTFDDRINETTENVQTSFETSFTNTSEFIANNWDEITTNQLDFESQFTSNMRNWSNQRDAILAGETEAKKEQEAEKTETAEQGAQDRTDIIEAETQAAIRAAQEAAAAIAMIDEGITDEKIGSVEDRNAAIQAKENAQLAEEARLREQGRAAFVAAQEERKAEALRISRETFEEQMRIRDENLRNFISNQEEQKKAQADAFIEGMRLREQNRKDFVRAQEIANREDEETWEESWERRISVVQNAFDKMKDIYQFGYGLVNDLTSTFFETEQNLDDIWYTTELSALQDQLDSKAITQEQFDTKLDELEKQRLANANELGKKEFKANKANQIAQAIISGASAIMQFWQGAAAFGPIAGPIVAGILTGIVTAATIAQVGLISRQQYVPKLQRGGRVGGMAEINEAGGEMVVLPDGSTVIPNDISRQIATNAGGGMGTTMNVSFAGAKISDDMDLRKVVNEVSRVLGRQLRTARV